MPRQEKTSPQSQLQTYEQSADTQAEPDPGEADRLGPTQSTTGSEPELTGKWAGCLRKRKKSMQKRGVACLCPAKRTTPPSATGSRGQGDRDPDSSDGWDVRGENLTLDGDITRRIPDTQEKKNSTTDEPRTTHPQQGEM
jgi:hypothetical protein